MVSSLNLAARTRSTREDGTGPMLAGPIGPVLLRLAAPTIAVISVQAVVNVAEAAFIGWLGPAALAGVSLVFPLIMLMQTMSAGGMGGGVASAVARALGAGRRRDADALAWHAVVIALVMGGAFTLVALASGPALYRAMGGEGPALAVAVAYSNVVFAGAAAMWLFNVLAAVVRGTGNMRLPAAVGIGGAALTVSLSPSLILGWGPFPRLGVVGAGVAFVTYYALGSLVLLGHLRSRRGLVHVEVTALRWPLFRDILRVGAPGALNTVQANLTVILLTGLVAPFGTYALAGYGMGARLEYLQIPLVFGLGSALVTMVGVNVGAGQHARAERIAWVGAAIAFALTETIGLAAAAWPRAWLGLFSAHPAVLAEGTRYLRTVGPVYGFLGLGLSLYFASQGAGHVLPPLAAGFARLVIAAAGGWMAVHWLHGGSSGVFTGIAVSLVVFGTAVAVATRRGAWRPHRRMPMHRSSHARTVAVVLAAWLGLVLVLGARGAFARPPDTPPLPILLGATVPLVVFAALYLASSAFRSLVLAADVRLLAAIHGWRAGGLAFIALYAHGVLPGLFAWPAGLGDIAIGVSAPWMALALVRRPGFATSRTFAAWNVLGILDLVVAVGTGVLSSGLLAGLAGSVTTAPMARLPLVLIPAYLVPVFVMLHVAALSQARRATRAVAPIA